VCLSLSSFLPLFPAMCYSVSSFPTSTSLSCVVYTHSRTQPTTYTRPTKAPHTDQFPPPRQIQLPRRKYQISAERRHTRPTTAHFQHSWHSWVVYAHSHIYTRVCLSLSLFLSLSLPFSLSSFLSLFHVMCCRASPFPTFRVRGWDSATLIRFGIGKLIRAVNSPWAPLSTWSFFLFFHLSLVLAETAAATVSTLAPVCTQPHSHVHTLTQLRIGTRTKTRIHTHTLFFFFVGPQIFCGPTPLHSHAHAHNHALAHAQKLAHTRAHTHTLSRSFFPSLAHTHTRIGKHTQTLALSLFFSLSLPLSLSHTHTSAYRVAKMHRMPWVAGLFLQKSH